MNRVVVLNSGGLDSTVLLHHVVKDIEKDSEVHSLHFTYGNKNHKMETQCVKRNCEMLGVSNKTIKLPKFDWTTSDFYKSEYDVKTQYLEYRNLVFVSYALSYAQSIGANKIYLAILYSHHGYNDTSGVFISCINTLSKSTGDISIETPFSCEDKQDLIPYVRKYNITPDLYFSCDVPTFGFVPCGECNDCLDILEIERRVWSVDTPMRRYLDCKNVKDEEFIRRQRNAPITEIRFNLNNKCQLKCKHCFYGYNRSHLPQLPKEVLYEAIKEGIDLGVNHIHFSGKEPLFDDTLFWYADRFKKDRLPITYSVVTNGINVPLYAKRLKDTGCEKVFLSVDVMLNGVRDTRKEIIKALNSLQYYKIPVEIFIDLHEGNYLNVKEIIESLYGEYYSIIKSFYVRTIKPIGNATGMPLLEISNLEEVYKQLKQCESPKYSLDLFIGIEYVPHLIDTKLGDIISHADDCLTNEFGVNFTINVEKYCTRYTHQITLTNDGFILGCASEVSTPDYYKISAGNITEYSMKELIARGKQILIEGQDNSCFECPFVKNCKGSCNNF